MRRTWSCSSRTNSRGICPRVRPWPSYERYRRAWRHAVSPVRPSAGRRHAVRTGVRRRTHPRPARRPTRAPAADARCGGYESACRKSSPSVSVIGTDPHALTKVPSPALSTQATDTGVLSARAGRDPARPGSLCVYRWRHCDPAGGGLSAASPASALSGGRGRGPCLACRARPPGRCGQRARPRTHRPPRSPWRPTRVVRW